MIILFIISHLIPESHILHFTFFIKTLVKIIALKKHFSFFLILCYEIWNAKKKPKKKPKQTNKVRMLYWYWNDISLAFLFIFVNFVKLFHDF